MWRLERRTKLSKPCLLTWKAGLQAPRLCLHCRPIILALTLNLNFGVLNPKHCTLNTASKLKTFASKVKSPRTTSATLTLGPDNQHRLKTLAFSGQSLPEPRLLLLTLGPNSQHRLKTFASTVKSPRTTSATVTASPDSQHRLKTLASKVKSPRTMSGTVTSRLDSTPPRRLYSQTPKTTYAVLISWPKRPKPVSAVAKTKIKIKISNRTS